MKSYIELKKDFIKKVEKLQANCKHEDVSDWVEEWWAINHPTGWKLRVCMFCNKKISRKTLCVTCSKELVEGVDVIKEVGSSWYCKECAPVAEAELKRKMEKFDKIRDILPEIWTRK